MGFLADIGRIILGETLSAAGLGLQALGRRVTRLDPNEDDGDGLELEILDSMREPLISPEAAALLDARDTTDTVLPPPPKPPNGSLADRGAGVGRRFAVARELEPSEHPPDVSESFERELVASATPFRGQLGKFPKAVNK